MKTLLELEKGECRFAFGDSDFLFCSEAVTEGSSYCEFHHRMCWEPVRVKPIKARVYHGTDFAA